MRLPPFQVHRPATLADARDLLARHGDDAVLYAGGSELLLVMKLGFAEYGHLVDIKGIAELHGLEVRDGVLHIGGCVTHRRIERSAEVREGWGALAEMEAGVANVRVRAVGTLGGNLAFADPHSDPATFLLAVDGTVRALGPDGARDIPMARFVLGPYHTALAPGEVVGEVLVPSWGDEAVVHTKLALHERPTATATCAVAPGPGGVERARIAVGSVGLVPQRLPGAEAVLRDTGDPAAAGRAAAEECVATEGGGASADYRRHLAGVLVRRAAERALGRETR